MYFNNPMGSFFQKTELPDSKHSLNKICIKKSSNNKMSVRNKNCYSLQRFYGLPLY